MSQLSAEMTVWVDSAHGGWVGSLMDLLGSSVHPLAVGGPDGGGHELAEQLGVGYERDLRKLLVDRPASMVLLACGTMPGVSELRPAMDAGTLVLTVEPAWADLDALEAAQQEGLHSRVVLVPRFERCPGFVAAADPQGSVGRPGWVRMSSVGPRAEGSWFARAFDAWRAVLGFVEMPESIDAAMMGTLPDRRSAAAALRQFTGRSSSVARCADGSVVSIDVADNAQATEASGLGMGRRLQAEGQEGRLTVRERGYELVHFYDDKGQPAVTVDRLAPSAEGVSFVDLVGSHIRRLIDRPPMTANPTLDARALACVHAMLLSARTNQPESPARLMQLVA